jgi:hypothetical protein
MSRPLADLRICPGDMSLMSRDIGLGSTAGAVTIAWHLELAGLRAPLTSRIRRVLHQAGLITARKRTA